ncbi:putative protein (TIGR00369 family) OS=Streptomyces albaduncus OX=68172 GN=FHS32_003496 PE=3 SV=1 [Streptomyces griseoloalbus]
MLAETLGSVGSMLHGGVSKIAVGVDLGTHDRRDQFRPGAGVAGPLNWGRSAARPRRS